MTCTCVFAILLWCHPMTPATNTLHACNRQYDSYEIVQTLEQGQKVVENAPNVQDPLTTWWLAWGSFPVLLLWCHLLTLCPNHSLLGCSRPYTPAWNCQNIGEGNKLWRMPQMSKTALTTWWLVCVFNLVAVMPSHDLRSAPITLAMHVLDNVHSCGIVSTIAEPQKFS